MRCAVGPTTPPRTKAARRNQAVRMRVRFTVSSAGETE
jgi:hypothetical protein